MCNLWMAATPAGREPDRGDGVTVYRHTVNGFTVRTHRTVRTTPAGWVYGVYDHTAAYDAAAAQYTCGYAPTKGAALRAASHYVVAGCQEVTR
jgi:hypothetical protein